MQTICQICSSSETVKKTDLSTSDDLMKLGRFDCFYCAECRLGFVSPQPKLSQLAIPSDEPQASYSFVERTLMKFFVHRRAKKSECDHNKPRKKLFDLGSGSGAFAHYVANIGHQVVAFDISESNRKHYLETENLKFVVGDFNQDILSKADVEKGSFDVVTMWHSLEHSYDPVESIKVAYELLKTGGRLVISVPNYNSLQRRIAGQRWVYLNIPFHLFHFTSDGLIRLLESSGFDIVKQYNLSFEYEFFGAFQSLLNLYTRSTNYYYNIRKKGFTDEALKTPGWTKFSSKLSVLVFPFALILGLIAIVSKKPSCIELVVVKTK